MATIMIFMHAVFHLKETLVGVATAKILQQLRVGACYLPYSLWRVWPHPD